MIIAIDGPTASGKSTIANALAQKLGMYYVATGLLYRALAYILVHHRRHNEQQLMHPKREDINWSMDPERFAYTYDKSKVMICFQGVDITPFLKTKEIDYYASLIAADKQVREEMLTFQRAFAQQRNVVAEGRDIGSVVFPNAEFKFFITASPQERARRWQQDQLKKGKQYSFEESLKTITERDRRDSERTVSPLKVTKEAIIIDTTTLTKEETLQKILKIVQKI